jgi:hypothetical protein
MQRVLELMAEIFVILLKITWEPVESRLIFRLFCPVHRLPTILIPFNSSFWYWQPILFDLKRISLTILETGSTFNMHRMDLFTRAVAVDMPTN